MYREVPESEPFLLALIFTGTFKLTVPDTDQQQKQIRQSRMRYDNGLKTKSLLKHFTDTTYTLDSCSPYAF